MPDEGKIRLGEAVPRRLERAEVLRELRRAEMDDGIVRIEGIQELLGHAAALLDEAVAVAREQGYSWEDIAEALGVTRQGAWARFGLRGGHE